MTQGRFTLTAGNWSVLVSLTFGGLLLYIFVVVYATVGEQSRFIRFDAPGTVDFELDWPGTYVVYEEYQRTPDKKAEIRPSTPDNLQAGLQHLDSGEIVELTVPKNPYTYKIQRKLAEGIYEFTVKEAGNYRFVSEFTEGETGTLMRLAIIPSPIGQVFYAFLWGVLFLLGVVGGVLLLAFWMGHRNARLQPAEEREVRA